MTATTVDTKAVRYDVAQTLSDPQKTQARTNIASIDDAPAGAADYVRRNVVEGPAIHEDAAPQLDRRKDARQRHRGTHGQREGSAIEDDALRGPQIHGDGSEWRRELVEVFEAIVATANARQQQVHLLAVVERGWRHSPNSSREGKLRASSFRRMFLKGNEELPNMTFQSVASIIARNSSADMPAANPPPMRPPMLVPAAISMGMWCSSNQAMIPT